MDEPGFKLSQANVAIIGLGLMGGSLALALHGHCRQLTGLDIDAQIVDLAQHMGAVDRASADPQTVLADADLVVLACPVPDILRWLGRLPEFIQQPCVVLDLGSSKRAILAAMQTLPARFDPIGAHPICGKETLSLRNADKDLYSGAPFVVTPLQRTSLKANQAVEQLTSVVEAHMVMEDAARHDSAMAVTSHLPYLLSSALALATPPQAGRFVGPGFRSTARLAGTPYSMMLGVLETNRDQVLESLKSFQEALNEMEQALAQDDLTALQHLLENAHDRYQTFL
jgi:prephenate dehydrogenase